MTTFALIGDPVQASPSPAMHRAAFRALGLSHDYTAIRVARDALSDELPGLLRRYTGLNVTTPLKEAIVPLLDEVDPVAGAAGSVNTVVLHGERAVGHSTDGAGFLAALGAAGIEPTPPRAVILGTGGAARAVAAALAGAGSAVLITGRTAASAARLARDLSVRAIDEAAVPAAVARAGLLVNATPLGGAGHPQASPLPDAVPLHPSLTVFDLVTRAGPTPLLAQAAAAGCRTVEGVAMLVEQGARSFELWTGRLAPVEVMRRAAARALDHAGVPA